MRHALPPSRIAAGFTLLELMTALAISALLAGLGWPLLARQRATTAVAVTTHHTMAALQSARQRALSTGHSVTVCPSTDGRRCGFGSNQWISFENRAGGLDSVRDVGEKLLRQWHLPAGVRATGTRGYAAYQPATRAATTLTFQFCHRGHPEVSRSVIVSQTGRPRITAASGCIA